MTARIMVSGGFDPVHPGHIAMFHAANRLGDVIVALNSDEWLIRKKGFFLMDWDSRARVLKEFRSISHVVKVDDTDGTVCQAIQLYRPNCFANGGDRTEANTPEKQLCLDMGIMLIWGCGGTKTHSSSEIVRRLP